MSATTATAEITRLRERMERIQGRRMDVPVLPVSPALSALLPGGGLRVGSSYAVPTSLSLLMAMLVGPSQAGSWCAVLGMPELGAEAAEQLGVDLDRLVLVPDPGPRWLAVAATLAEVVPVVAVRPAGRVTDGQAARLAARLRESDAVLLVAGPWPQAEAVLQVEAGQWTGTGQGRGYLRRRVLTVSVLSRRGPRPRRGRIVLPDEQGGVQAVSVARGPVTGGGHVPDVQASPERMRAVG